MSGAGTRARWATAFHDHLTKQLAVKDRGLVEMSGLRANVRQIGESWLWTIEHVETNATDTSLAAGCEQTAEGAATNAANALARCLDSAKIP